MGSAVSITQLNSSVFEEWQVHLEQAVGHHRSTLLTASIPFSSRMTLAQLGEVSIVALEGQSSLRLHRFQPSQRAVLWLPRQGWVEERLNGEALIAEPGSAMLCLPGDELLGETSPSLKGVSVVLPFALLGDPGHWQGFRPRHLAMGSESVSLISIAMELVASVLEGNPDSQHLVATLVDHLLFWRDLTRDAWADHSAAPVERRRLIARARDWMGDHLQHPFTVADLAEALHVSTRTLQACFRDELGHSPSLEARRLRFLRLRQQLRSCPAVPLQLEALFRDCGLPFTPQTRRLYRDWCGETPLQSLARASGC